jgi:hypothetical protein
MVKRITADETQAWLKEYFGRLPDIGLGKAIVNLALCPPNPFVPEKKRLPRRGFLFGAGMFLSAVAWFLYFNFAR